MNKKNKFEKGEVSSVSGNFDFTLISAHLAWGSESDRDAGYEKIKDIFDNSAAYSSDPDIILFGDFNRFGKDYKSVKKIPYDASEFLAPNITFFDPDFNTIKNVTMASIIGKGVPYNNPQPISTTVAANKMVYPSDTKHLPDWLSTRLFR